MDHERHRVAANGARVFYRAWRPPAPRGALVLLHGVASNSTRWWDFVAGSALRDSWCLIRIDRRGQGQSADRRAAGILEWCEDIAGIVEDEGFAQAIVGGHCLGANIALEFAARIPARTAGLVLVEPMLPGCLAGTMRRTSRLRPVLVVLEALVRAANALGIHRRQLRALDLEVLDRETRAVIAGTGDARALERYASPFFDLETTPCGSYLRDLLAVTAPLTTLAAVHAPSLVLLSRESTFTDPQATRRALAGLADATLVELDARHWIPTEQPRELREAIDAWVERRLPAPGR
jgi:pimeloyl-ACP methyl ester carboxylesterase